MVLQAINKAFKVPDRQGLSMLLLTMIRRRTYWDLGTKSVSRSWAGHRYYGFSTTIIIISTLNWCSNSQQLQLSQHHRRKATKYTGLKEELKRTWQLETACIIPPVLSTYLLNPWHRVLLEELTVSQLVKKFPTFYGNRRFITAFISAFYLSYPKPDQSSPCPHISLPADPS